MFVLVAGFVVAAAIVGRPWFLVVPPVTIVLYAIGLKLEWWGNGLPEEWQASVIITIAACLAGAAVGLLLRHALDRLNPRAHT